MSHPSDPPPGYPGEGPAAGYGQPAYDSPGYGQPDQYTQVLPTDPYGGYGPGGSGSPDRSRKWAFIFGGILLLVLCAGGGFYGAFALTQNGGDSPDAAPTRPVIVPSEPAAQPSEVPSEVPSAEPSAEPSGEPQAAAAFTDPELREFAGSAARDAQCQGQSPAGADGVTEIVNCQFSNFTVRYLKFDSGDARDRYAQLVRSGLGGQLDVQRNSVWSNARGRRQGRFISGSQANDTRQYVYWNSDDDAVSGELVISGSRRNAAEAAWRSL